MLYEVNDCEVFFSDQQGEGINPGSVQLNGRAAV